MARDFPDGARLNYLIEIYNGARRVSIASKTFVAITRTANDEDRNWARKKFRADLMKECDRKWSDNVLLDARKTSER